MGPNTINDKEAISKHLHSPVSNHIEDMWNLIFPLVYGSVVIILLWQAIKVMTNGFNPDKPSTRKVDLSTSNEDRTGRITIHPELLDQEGRITDEELLTVRFSGDNEPPLSAETPSE